MLRDYTNCLLSLSTNGVVKEVHPTRGLTNCANLAHEKTTKFHNQPVSFICSLTRPMVLWLHPVTHEMNL